MFSSSRDRLFNKSGNASRTKLNLCYLVYDVFSPNEHLKVVFILVFVFQCLAIRSAGTCAKRFVKVRTEKVRLKSIMGTVFVCAVPWSVCCDLNTWSLYVASRHLLLDIGKVECQVCNNKFSIYW